MIQELLKEVLRGTLMPLVIALLAIALVWMMYGVTCVLVAFERKHGKIIRFADDWCFPFASNHLTSVELWSQGRIFESGRAELPFAELVTPLALVPGESEVFFGRTARNSYRFEWHSAHPNRDANVATNAAIEIFHNWLHGNKCLESFRPEGTAALAQSVTGR